MTPPVPDHSPPERDERDWNGPQQADSSWYDVPPYDDTGWHPELTDQNDERGRHPQDYRGRPGRGATGDNPFPYEAGYDGNGLSPREPSPGRRPAGPSEDDRRSGRHARHGQRGSNWQDDPAYYQQPGPETSRDYQGRYPEPRPRADYGPGPGSMPPRGRGRPDDRRYPQPRPDPRRSDYDQPRGRRRGRYPEQPRTDSVRMSDPATFSDAARAASRPRSDMRGQPAFMHYPDAPIYAEPPGQPFSEQTVVLPVMWPPRLTDRDAADLEAADQATQVWRRPSSPSIVRSSSVMAIGTLASRLTGFVRTLIQVYALGLVVLAAAYNNANTLPNVVYNLALGGILTSVIVPLIVNAARRETDGGEGYDQRMFTLITTALLGITIIATLATVPLVDLYKGHISGYELHLVVVFAYFFIPQIFFYGMSSLIGAVLNARGSFAAPMWTPVVNNVVVIAVLLMYTTTAGRLAGSSNPHVSSGDVLLLGLGTTIGIAAQTVALIPALRKVGFRWRPRWDFRRGEVAEIRRMGGWMFCYIAATQVAFLVTTNVCNIADPKYGYNAYTYAWQLFQLPYAVVGISVITALLPRMSSHASEGQYALVREDFSAGVRLASVIVVPCSLILAALGPGLALVFLNHGHAAISGGASNSRYIGVVFAVFCLGLLPYMIFQLQLRVFYSLHDSKTPALIGLGTMSLNIVANLIALNALPKHDVVAGLGVGFGLANLLGTYVAWRILSRRLRGLGGRQIRRTLVRMHAAAIPAALLVVFVGMIFGTDSFFGATGTIILGGGGALLLYLMFAKALQVTELTSLGRSVMSRFGR